MADDAAMGGIKAVLGLDQKPAMEALQIVGAELVKTEDKIRRTQAILDAYGDATGKVAAKIEQFTRKHADLNKIYDEYKDKAEDQARANERMDKSFQSLAATQQKAAAAEDARLAKVEASYHKQIALEDALAAKKAEAATKANISGANWQLGQMTMQPGQFDAYISSLNQAAIAQAQLSHAEAAAANVQDRMNSVLAEGVTMEMQATKTVANRAQKLQELALVLQTTTRAQIGLNTPVGQYTSVANQSCSASENAAYGMLHLAHAIQDAQYGFGAVLNNIPLVVQAMGGGPGLAGVIMTVGVAINVIKPLIGDLDVALGLVSDKSNAAGSTIDELKEKLKALTEKGWKVKVDYDAIRDTETKIKNREEAQKAFEAGNVDPVKKNAEDIAGDRVKQLGGTNELAKIAASNESAKDREHGKIIPDDIQVRIAKKLSDVKATRGVGVMLGHDMVQQWLDKFVQSKADEFQESQKKANEEFATRMAGKFAKGDPEGVQYFQRLAKDEKSGLNDAQRKAILSVPGTAEQAKELYTSSVEKTREAKFIEQQKAEFKAKEEQAKEDEKRDKAAEDSERDSLTQTRVLAETLVPGIKDEAAKQALAIDKGGSRDDALASLRSTLISGNGNGAGLGEENAGKAGDSFLREAMKGTPEERKKAEVARKRSRMNELHSEAELALPGFAAAVEGAVGNAALLGKPIGDIKAELAKKLQAAGMSAKDADEATGNAVTKAAPGAKKNAESLMEQMRKEESDTGRGNVSSQISGTSDLTARVQGGVNNGQEKANKSLEAILAAIKENNAKIIQVGFKN